MPRIINSTYITLDGAVEDPHLWPSHQTEESKIQFEIQNELLQSCDAVLMGRRTYDSFAAVWPTRSGGYSDRINSMRKYVVSSTLENPSWNNTRVIGRDLVAEITALKQQPGQDIVQYGLGSVSFALIDNGLIDEIRLWVHPIILGSKGPKSPHFLGCAPTRLQLAASKTLPSGVVILNYKFGGAT
jgi:dihydrofolate reductase